jgi:hypothetical protein
MKKIAILILIAIAFGSCSKKDDVETIVAPEPTNKGTGVVNYNGTVNLTVTASTNEGGGYSLLGEGKTGNNSLSLFISFPKKPTAGNYTPAKDNVTVVMDVSNGNVTLRNDLKSTETITVTTSGNRLEASFKDAKFDLRGSTVTYSGNLTVN